jgi:hypothetical protein
MHVKFQANMEGVRFLALDKAIRPTKFIDIVEIDGVFDNLAPDPEWLAITGLAPDSQFRELHKVRKEQKRRY